MMAITIMKMLRQRKAARPSFWRILICTFQRRWIGIARTVHSDIDMWSAMGFVIRRSVIGVHYKGLRKEGKGGSHTEQVCEDIQSNGGGTDLSSIVHRAGHYNPREISQIEKMKTWLPI